MFYPCYHVQVSFVPLQWAIQPPQQRSFSFEISKFHDFPCPSRVFNDVRHRGVAGGGGSRGSGTFPLAPRNLPLLFLTVILSSKSVMDSRFLKFLVLFYAYNKYGERWSPGQPRQHSQHLDRVVRSGGHYRGKFRCCAFHTAQDQLASASRQCTSPDTIWLR